jgi:hypothetical protein
MCPALVEEKPSKEGMRLKHPTVALFSASSREREMGRRLMSFNYI